MQILSLCEIVQLWAVWNENPHLLSSVKRKPKQSKGKWKFCHQQHTTVRNPARNAQALQGLVWSIHLSCFGRDLQGWAFLVVQTVCMLTCACSFAVGAVVVSHATRPADGCLYLLITFRFPLTSSHNQMQASGLFFVWPWKGNRIIESQLQCQKGKKNEKTKTKNK